MFPPDTYRLIQTVSSFRVSHLLMGRASKAEWGEVLCLSCGSWLTLKHLISQASTQLFCKILLKSSRYTLTEETDATRWRKSNSSKLPKVDYKWCNLTLLVSCLYWGKFQTPHWCTQIWQLPLWLMYVRHDLVRDCFLYNLPWLSKFSQALIFSIFKFFQHFRCFFLMLKWF